MIGLSRIRCLKILIMWYFFNGDIVLADADPDSVTSFSGDIGLVNLDLNNVTLDHDNFYNYDPKTMLIT